MVEVLINNLICVSKHLPDALDVLLKQNKFSIIYRLGACNEKQIYVNSLFGQNAGVV